MTVYTQRDPLESWEIVQRAQAGDSDAMAELYLRYRDQVRWLVLKRVRLDELADDLTADVFVRMIAGIGGFTFTGCDFGAWLNTLATNRVADYFKSSYYRRHADFAELSDVERPDYAMESRPADAAIAREDCRQLYGLIRSELSEQQRQCVQLRFLQEMSVDETAAAMGKTVGASKEMQHRAIRNLRLAYQQEASRWLRTRHRGQTTAR